MDDAPRAVVRTHRRRNSAELYNGSAKMVLAMCMQLVHETLLHHMRRSAAMQQLCEQDAQLAGASPEALLLRWVNVHLTHANWGRAVADWGLSFADSAAFLVLLRQLAPQVVSEAAVADCMRLEDLAVRADAMLQLAASLQCRRFVTATGISAGTEHKRNVRFVACLFSKFPSVGPSAEALQSQLRAERERLAHEQERNAQLAAEKYEAESSLLAMSQRCGGESFAGCVVGRAQHHRSRRYGGACRARRESQFRHDGATPDAAGARGDSGGRQCAVARSCRGCVR